MVINGDGTVTDTSTGLMWQQGTAGPMSWEAAISYCGGLSLAGHDDWRLPNRNELQSLVDYTHCEPPIDTTAFPDTMSSYYLSSTTYAGINYAAWFVYFYHGSVGIVDKSSPFPVRAVRSVIEETPTLIELDQFTAASHNSQILVTWNTASEIATAGFNLLRSEGEYGEYIRINPRIIEAKGDAIISAEYSYTDDTALPGVVYCYKLEDIDTEGVSRFHGPGSATIPAIQPSYFPYWLEWYSLWPPVYNQTPLFKPLRASYTHF